MGAHTVANKYRMAYIFGAGRERASVRLGWDGTERHSQQRLTGLAVGNIVKFRNFSPDVIFRV